MKKILLATTMLTLTAGVAAAEITFSGDARFGLQYREFADPNTIIEKRMTINIDGSGETDGGITFGGRIRIRSNELSDTTLNGARLYVTSGGFTLAVGNIWGALDSMPGIYDPSVGLTGLDYSGVVLNWGEPGNTYWAWTQYTSSAAGSEGIEAIYEMGDFTAHLSYVSASLNDDSGGYDDLAFYASYKIGDWIFAAGMADNENITGRRDHAVITVGGKIGDYGVGLAIADNDGFMKVVVNGSATFGATTVNAFIANEERYDMTTWGLGASYDLGGGASLVGGISSATERFNPYSNEMRADFGISMSF